MRTRLPLKIGKPVREDERGVALIAVLLALMLLTAIGLGMMYSANIETDINSNYRDSVVAHYAAQSGLEEGRARLRTSAADHIDPPSGMPSTSVPNIVYIVNGSDVEPWNPGNAYYDSQWSQEFSLSGVTGSCVTSPSSSGWCVKYNTGASFAVTPPIPYRWVRITTKGNNSTLFPVNGSSSNSTQVCWDDVHEQLLPAGYSKCEATPGMWQPVYMVTSLAVTNTGARRSAQWEIAPRLPVVTKGAVDSKDDVTLKGSYTISGYDNCSCQCSGSGSSYTCTTRAGSAVACDTSKYAVYTAGSITINGSSGNSYAGTTPVIADHAPWTADIPKLIDQYKSLPDTVKPYGNQCSGSPADCGTRSSQVFGTYPTGMPNSPSGAVPQVTYVGGSVQLTSSSTGSGILIVDGDLDVHGGMNFYGLIIVRGVTTFSGGGSDQVNLYGAILSGEKLGAADAELGGSVSLQYDSCALKQIDSTKFPFTIISSRELPF